MRLKPGLSTLTGVLIISSILLTSGLALHTSLRNALISQRNQLQTTQLESLGQSCAYEGWYQLTLNTEYRGSSLSLENGDCQISVTNEGKRYIITADARLSPHTEQFVLTVEEQNSLLVPIQFEHTF